VLFTNGDWDIRLPAPVRPAPEKEGPIWIAALERTVRTVVQPVYGCLNTGVQWAVAGGATGALVGAQFGPYAPEGYVVGAAAGGITGCAVGAFVTPPSPPGQ
jgi:hypothetical protein